MPKSFLTITIALLVILAALLACTGATPAPDPTETAAAPVGNAASPTNTPVLEATATQAPTPRPTATVRPTDAPPATPAGSPTPEPIATQTPVGILTPLAIHDPQAMLPELSESELACIRGDPNTLTRAFAGIGPQSREEETMILGCLEDETINQLFLATVVTRPEPLGVATSACIRAAFDVINPRDLLNTDIMENQGKVRAASWAAFLVTNACLNDEEGASGGPKTSMKPEERAQLRCFVEALGGPGAAAEAMVATQGGDDTLVASAAENCGMELGPLPWMTPATSQPVPTATPTPVPTPPTSTPTSAPTPTTTLIITVAGIPPGLPEYDRGEWRHWVDEDGDCQDARQEVLIAESLVAVTYETDRECRVETGQWWAPHLGHHLGNPGHIDVDHHVPLKNAHLSGGWKWDAATKEEYANYLEDPDHLVAISARHNRSKGARGPEEWAPPDNMLWCQYATDWTEIKELWGLTMTPVESEIVMDMLHTCEDPPDMEVETLDTMVIRTGVHKPTPEPGVESFVYGTCEDAEAAGEQRILGSSGGGRGFPAELVPSARDGDGDGVVCER